MFSATFILANQETFDLGLAIDSPKIILLHFIFKEFCSGNSMNQNRQSVKEKLTGDFPQAHILSIEQIFFSDIAHEICRPDFQRPYRWKEKHVNTLLSDLQNDLFKSNQSDYFLGTITIYYDKENQKRNIVDGLQRLTTLYLILCALDIELRSKPIPNFFTDKDDDGLTNIKNNFKAIEKWLQTNSHGDLKKFIRENCFVAWNEVGTYDEAFQVFEGRNTKGKALKPHDLLKAFHFRKLSSDVSNPKDILEKWEHLNENQLHQVFETLYRIRAWSKGNYDAWEFTKENRQEFQGLDFRPNEKHTRIESFYYTFREQLKTCYFISPQPFNGEDFFDWVSHLFAGFKWFSHEYKGEEKNRFIFNGEHGKDIDKFFNYKGRWRKGDLYCQAVLRALLLLYLDRFSHQGTAPENDQDIKENFEKLFNFVYQHRIEQTNGRDAPVTVRKMLNMLEKSQIFEKMNRTYSLEDFKKIPIEQVDWEKLQMYDKLPKESS